MGDKRGDTDKKKMHGDDMGKAIKKSATTREKLRELCECDKVISDVEMLAFGRVIREDTEMDDNVSSSDEVDEFLEAECRRLNDVLGLPVDTYSLTKIRPDLPTCVKYGVRSGLTHQNMQKFSPLSRGFQGSAIAIAAFATTALMKAGCWNEMIIDQIVEDGDTYYCESYERLCTDDRKTLTVLDLAKDFVIQKTHRVSINVDDPAYAGTFRSKNPTDLHLVKALELFFERNDAGVLTSPGLNIAIWKDSKYFNIFDGQPRKDNLLPTTDDSGGSAKLILVRDLIGVLFVILEKSALKNEHFVLYGLEIQGIHRLPLIEDDPEEPEKSVGKPRRRPSGYKIRDKFRALVQGSFHLTHELIPEELRGHGDLVIALTALIYSRLVNANKWTNAMIDLIFNQAHIYLVDLARVLEKKLDNNFELKIDEIMGDVIIGVYAAKIKIEINVVPGQAKKGKATIDADFRDFFMTNSLGILEIKKKFYAVWKEGEKYYFLDPFPCDDEGFRMDPNDAENVERYKKARACVTMNSSINELIEIILENTENKEKDPFVLHGLGVLYVKTGSISGGALDTVIYREKKTNRRPLPPPVPPAEYPDDCKILMNMVPRPRPDAERIKHISTQYPELMERVGEYMMKEDEPITFVEGEPETRGDSKHKQTVAENGVQDDRNESHAAIEKKYHLSHDESSTDNNEHRAEEKIKFIKGYSIINPHRIILHGSKNCLTEEFEETSRGRQGVALALTAIAYAKIKDPTTWRNLDVDQILRVGDQAHSDIVSWIRQGSPEQGDDEKGDAEEVEKGKNEEEEEDADEEKEEDEEDDEDDGGKAKTFKGILKRIPSYVGLSMLSDRIKLGENNVRFKKKMSVVEGDADPLANLGEALEHYFKNHNEVILENKRLMYGMWKQDDKYFVLNPYGSDEDGWRLRDYPASLVVTDTINELIDLFHGVLEFNDRIFSLHFVGIESIQPDNKYIVPVPVEIPEDDFVEKYETKFLPVTDEDLFVPELESELVETETIPETALDDKDEDDEDEEDNEDKENNEEDEKEEDEEEKDLEKKLPEPEIPLEDPLLEVDEQGRPDAPDQLNLSLLTGSVKIEEDDIPDQEMKETVMYERLKYNHPPPYVLPPKKVLCVLLEAKNASKSTHSLISRFSIDSKLAVKAATDLPAGKQDTEPAIATVTSSSADEGKPSKMIKLPPKKYLFSRIPPIGFTPLRAINEKFIQNEELDKIIEEECRKKKTAKTLDEFVLEEIPENPIGIRITPEVIPLGPTIKTPTPKKKLKPCPDHPKSRKCKVSDAEREDAMLEKILCDTEDVLFDMIFPNRGNKEVINIYDDPQNEDKEDTTPNRSITTSAVRIKHEDDEEPSDPAIPETLGFLETDDDVGIIEGNMCLENRSQVEECHFKSCFFAAILCILTKVRLDVNLFRGSILDQLILASDKIHQRTGKLRYKPLRWFHNIVVLGARCNIILKQYLYADPENCEADELSRVLENYLVKNQTGILVFSNASYAFWFANDKYYLFDPYACDDNGRANDNGFACLLEFCELEDMVKRIKENNGTPSENPYRIYSLSIAHMESIKKKKRPKRRLKRCSKNISEESFPEEMLEDPQKLEETFELKEELSLMELADWVINDDEPVNKFDMTLSGFVGVKNFDASALEVVVVENDVTRPILAPFKKLKGGKGQLGDDLNPLDPPRKKPYDRKFREQTCHGEPIDLCIIAWSYIHDPTLWGVRTIRGIYEASKDLTFDSLLAVEDSSITEMIDGVLMEFSIANYSFRAVLAPLHHGILYTIEGWNLAMSLKKLFEVPIYSGAVLVCGKAHIGLMKKGVNHYAWWAVPKTKNLRIITSEVFDDFLKLVVKAIGEREQKEFVLRVVTISYARKLDPDCTDVAGLHEPVIPASSLAEIHRKPSPPYDLEAIFRPTMPNAKPIFVLGNVALRNRDTLTEPKVKRCYFVAVLSVMVKRDIIQSPMPGMIDKIIEVAENLYKQFDEPKYHTEHILRNVTIMNRIFDFRDCASALFIFKENPNTGKNDFYCLVRKQLRRHLKGHTDGIIQFTNCCYGFWYSRATNAYYFIDPYQCNFKGRSVSNGGKACLCIFSSICQMAKHMCVNRFEDATGFFIHRLHVESINVPPFDKFQEDPMWVYLDYHWSFSHSSNVVKSVNRKNGRKKKRVLENENDEICKESKKEEPPKPSWNYYTIEVPNLIYSVWGTLGCYDLRFGDRVGKNKAAISVAILAMQYLCHPSRWGAAILDSAVICGDSYYTESLKSSVKRGSKYSNRFNLQSCFKVFPHIWTIEFLANMCGILYSGKDRPNLATILQLAFENSSSLVLECGKVAVSILSAEDGFYAVDPCWTGPPLFAKNHGAVYALRCKNMNALIYVITKMFNTNQRLEFHVTPVIFNFSQESCKFADRREKLMQKEILMDPLGTKPGIADGPKIPVSGAITVPDEDAYLWYRKNMGIGILQGKDLEDPSIPSPVPWMPNDNMNNLLISTAWHLNTGKPSPKKKLNPPYEQSIIKHNPEECKGLKSEIIESRKTSSMSDKIQLCNGYPRTIDIAAGKYVTKSSKILTRKKVVQEIPSAKPLDCLPRRSFLLDTSRREFDKWNKEMADEAYKNYKHRVMLNAVEKSEHETSLDSGSDDKKLINDEELPGEPETVNDNENE